MILVTATLNVKPGCQKKLTKLTTALIHQSKLEPGGFGCTLYHKADQPDVFLLLEEWQNLAALENHYQQPHFKSFIEDAQSLLTSTPLIRQFTTLSE
ncbi:putative quinol monooxygenase [Spirosoma arcticum]